MTHVAFWSFTVLCAGLLATVPGCGDDDDGGEDTDTDTGTGSMSCDNGVWDGHLTITGAAGLGDLSGYTEVTGNLTISNTILTDLSDLECLATMGGTLRIESNDTLANLDGLSNLATVDGTLHVDSNGTLTTIDLPALTLVGLDLVIQNHESLINLNLPALTKSENLTIVYNAYLTSLNLASLSTVIGTLRIEATSTLTNLDGLSSLDSVGWWLVIGNNTALTTVDMPALTTVGDKLGFSENHNLTLVNMPALSNCGDLDIFENFGNTTMNMPALTSVGDLSITRSGVANLDGLSNLAVVDNSLFISESGSLVTVNMPALTSVGGTLGIYNNMNLPDCRVCQLLEQLTTGPSEVFADNNSNDTCTPVPTNCP